MSATAPSGRVEFASDINVTEAARPCRSRSVSGLWLAFPGLTYVQEKHRDLKGLLEVPHNGKTVLVITQGLTPNDYSS